MRKSENKLTEMDEILETNQEKDKNLDEKEGRVYELGFLLDPAISEDKLDEEFSLIKKVIENNKGSFISEEWPKIKKLEYTIFKASHDGKKRYDTAYFSWIKFETTPLLVDKIYEEIKKNEKIIRFIIIKTVKKDTLAVIRKPVIRKKRKVIEKKEQDSGISKEELDKTIDELVIN
ncbi:30S ribosomal protein S6 [Patescibacteria group bacterium]|nr:30S ribosomal protein S6 [Patescibacteria group bacterium]MBU4057612.1 30S ribosomal protein S6 [Patescibacteria group bacterium]MBU4116050.1 30S ribosomal protein S6 [Patescibacteria group bacterium]